MTRTLAHAQADLTERTEALRESNDGKAVAEQHLRAEYERQKDRGKDLSDRALQVRRDSRKVMFWYICEFKET